MSGLYDWEDGGYPLPPPPPPPAFTVEFTHGQVRAIKRAAFVGLLLAAGAYGYLTGPRTVEADIRQLNQHTEVSR